MVATLERRTSHEHPAYYPDLTDEQVEALVGDDTSWDDGADDEAPVTLDESPKIQPELGDEQAEPAIEEIQTDYNRLLRAAREAYREEKRSIHRLAYALLDLREAYSSRYYKEPSLLDLEREMGVGLTQQRIGQLIAVAEFFPRAEVNTQLDFKTYELARAWAKTQDPLKKTIKIGENETKLVSGEPLLALAAIKAHPETKHFRDILAAQNKKRSRANSVDALIHTLVITLKSNRSSPWFGDGLVIDGDKERRPRARDWRWLTGVADEVRGLAEKLARTVEKLKATADNESQLSSSINALKWYRDTHLTTNVARERYDNLTNLAQFRGVKFGIVNGRELEPYRVIDEDENDIHMIPNREQAAELRSRIIAYITNGEGYDDTIIRDTLHFLQVIQV